MTGTFSLLIEADIATLIDWVLADQPEVRDLDNQQRLALVEAFTARLASAAGEIAHADWPRTAAAFEAFVKLADEGKHSASVRRLNLMSVLLRDGQPRRDVAVLNPEYGAEVFFGAIDLEIEDASRLATRWRQESTENILRLRNIKNMLTPLVTFSHLIADPILRACVTKWASLLPLLP